jgi:DNA-binding GntR family transcriptional regulator
MPTSAERAYKFIRTNILTGRYGSGTRLKEQEIASVLAISRTPVRDAIRRLHSDGLIDFEPNQGARVTTWSEVDLRETSEMRALLESFAAELAAAKIGAAQLNELDRHTDAMRAALEQDEPRIDQISAANLAFHHGIVLAANNSRLLQVIEGLWVLPLVAQKFALFDRASLEQSVNHHREIIRALRAGDGDWASAIMRAHILAARGYDSVLASMSMKGAAIP